MKDMILIVLGILWILFLLGDTFVLLWVARYMFKLIVEILSL